MLNIINDERDHQHHSLCGPLFVEVSKLLTLWARDAKLYVHVGGTRRQTEVR